MISSLVLTLTMLGILIMPLRVGAAEFLALVTPAQASAEVVVTGLQVHNGAVSGTVVNQSPKTISDVKLLIRQAWLWNDERHPAADSPGRTVAVTVSPEISPHGSATFTFRVPPTSSRSDGRFATTAEVVAFTERDWR